MKRKIEIVIILCIVLLVSSLPTMAKSKQDSPFTRVYEKMTYYKTDTRVPENERYQIPEQGKLRIEKGATMSVVGNLEVGGTLKNYGTLYILDGAHVENKKEPEEPTNPGRVTVKGKIENYGTIIVENGNLDNQAGAEIYNYGTIILKNNRYDFTVFSNQSYSNGTAIKGSYLYNDKKGVIIIATEQGVGLRNYKGAVIENKGSIQIEKNAVAKGKIVGNKITRLKAESTQ